MELFLKLKVPHYSRMRFTLIFFYFLLCISGNSFLFSQKNFVSFEKIRASVISPSQRTTAIATDKYIYFLQNSDFQLLDSISIPRVKDRVVSDLFFVHGNMVGIRYGTTNTYMPDLLNARMQFYEYPEDSIFLYNLEKKTLFSRLSGNCYVAASVGNKSLMGYNDYYEYTNDWGAKLLGSAKGEFVFFDGDQQLRSFANGSVIGQCISPNGNELALMYYASDSVVIEIRKSSDLTVVSSTKLNTDGTSLRYSDDGKFLIIFNQDPVSKEENFVVYDFEAQKLVETINYSSNYIKGKIENGAFWTLRENSIKEIDLISGRLKTEVWANLTDFADITNFFKLNDNELVVVGNKRDWNGGFDVFWGVEKVNLKDLKIFSDQTFYANTIDSSYVFDLSKPFLQNNNILDGKKQFSSNGALMLIHSTSRLQLWDLVKRLKIHDLYFDDEIVPYLSSSGEEVLLFKSAKGKSFDDFYLEVINIKTGLRISKAYIDNPFSFVDHSNGTAIQMDENKKSWYYFNYYGCEIFEINTENLEIKAIREEENLGTIKVEAQQRMKIPKTDKVLLQLRYGDINGEYDHAHSVLVEEKSGYYIFDLSDSNLIHLKNVNYSQSILPTRDHHFLVSDTSAKMIQLVDLNAKLIKSIKFPKDINLNYFKWFANESSLYLASESKDSVLLYSYYPNLDFKSRLLFKGSFADLHLAENQFICSEGYSDDQSWFSYFTESQLQVNWLAKQVEAKISNSISLHKNYLYINNFQVLDLSTLTLKDTEKRKSFNPWFLLKSQNALVNVISEGGWNNEPKFIFVEARDFDNFDSVLWASNKIKCNEFLTPSLSAISYDGKVGSIELSKFADNPLNYSIDFTTHQLTKLGKTEIIISSAGADQISIGLASQNVEFEGKSYYSREYLSMARYCAKKELILAIGSKLYVWEKGNSSPIKIIEFSGFYADHFIIENDRVYIISRERMIDAFDLNTFEKLMTIEIVGDEDNPKVIAYTPEGYFKAPKEAIRELHFIKEGLAFPLLNYELFLNRPDILLSRTSFADAETIEVYKQAYLKRLERNGVKDLTEIASLKTPEVQLTSTVPAIAKEQLLPLSLRFSVDASSFVVYVNGVSATSQKVPVNLIESIEVPLHNGLNSISIVAKSKEGIESDPAFTQVNYAGTQEKSKIYFVGLGVSKYQDSSWNLNYADDDVRTLYKFLGNENYFTSEVVIDTLINEQATKANYLALKQKLLQTTVNDYVVISLSGHGMLDEDKNFYFGTHDVDFSNPARNGLSYADIQSLVEGIPARKKLLLIDACHSGEVNEGNKENWIATNNQPAKEGQKGGESENVGAINSLDDESFEIMKNTFQDLDRGNGTFVISAAGAKEYAIEKGGNGIFTMSFINAIADWKWDNKGSITISQLQKEIYKRVLEKTEGQQKPTSRSENVEWDWILE